MIEASAIGPSAALIAGLTGSAHCLAMCGGMSSALATHSAGMSALQQLARIGGYATAGALCGAMGGTIQLVLDLARIGTLLRVASGVLLLLLAARLMLRWNAFARIEQLGAKFWTLLRPFATYGANSSGIRQALTLGFLWGWLPCGLVYSVLLFSATSGSAASGAATMAAFGLGTLPSMLASSVFALQLRQLLAKQSARAVSACMLLIFGTWLIVAAVIPMHHHVH